MSEIIEPGKYYKYAQYYEWDTPASWGIFVGIDNENVRILTENGYEYEVDEIVAVPIFGFGFTYIDEVSEDFMYAHIAEIRLSGGCSG